MTEEFSVVKIGPGHSEGFWRQVAALHQEEIDGGFLSSLATGSLSLLYAALARSNCVILLAAIRAQNGGQVAGFICGSTDTSRVYRDVLLRSGFRILLTLLPMLLCLGNVIKITETLLYPTRRAREDLPRTEILNFCVSRRLQGRGIGRRLFAELMQEFRKRGITRCKIVTGDSQDKARRFYESMNAQRVGGIEIHRGARSLVFVHQIA